MKKPLLITSLLFAGVLFMGALSPSEMLPRVLEGRSGSELSLFLVLNGERSRPTQSDGGGLMLWTTDAGIASATVSGGLVYYFENVGSTACHLCGPNPDQGTWDGGCNTTTSDVNYGSPLAVSGFRWISLRDSTTTVKAVPATGAAACSIAVNVMR